MRARNCCFGFALCFAVLCPPAAIAAPSTPSAYPRSADNLPFGFDRLRWGMSSEEVRRAYPELNFDIAAGGFPVSPATAWGPAMLSLDDYPHGGCSFRVGFTFYHARLFQVGFGAKNMDDALRNCRRQVRRELTAQYGPPADPRIPRWSGPVTNASYVVPLYGPHYEPGTPVPVPPLNLAFGDANDISGYQAALALDQNNKCQSITAAFLPDTSGDGASTPIIAPRLLDDLGCDYPPISYRLQEQGMAVVTVRILTDGSVGSAEVTTPDSPMRLNAAAIDIVRNKLLIYPAIKDGKQVESERQIAVTFKITRPLRGTP